MKEKGIIITSLLYAILAMFILILFTIILTFGIRKNLISNVSNKIESELDYIAPQIKGLAVLPVFSGQTFTEANYAAGLIATDNVDGDVTETISCTMSGGVISCTAVDNSGNVSAPFTRTTTTVSVLTYHYTGSSQKFVAANTGTYKIELWGASGGSSSNGTNTYRGGYGGYSTGTINLAAGTTIYIYVGGAGINNSGTSGPITTAMAGGYNGGGTVPVYASCCGGHYPASGGGASHIAIKAGLLSSLTSNTSSIIIVAGGGGAGFAHGTITDLTLQYYGGSGGGISGTAGMKVSDSTAASGNPGTQSSGFAFGQGGASDITRSEGGGGYYGGYVYAGGSGYIGNSSLTSKYMYCYNCTTSTAADTMTYTTTNYSATATTNYAKSGNGYAKITFVSN